MKLIVIYGQKWLDARWLPEVLRCEAFVFYPFIVFKEDKDKVPKTTVRHELIHIRQLKRDGLIKSTVLYTYYYVKNYLRYKDFDKAYREIPYEKEAYKKERYITLTPEEKEVVGWE
jgi:hypothetical protein